MKPLSVGELLDAAFSAVRRNFGTLVLCTLVIVVPVSILNTLVLASSNEAAFDFAGQSTLTDDDLGLALGGTAITNLISLLAQTLTAAACLRAIGGDIVGSPAGAGASLRYAFGRFLPLLWVAILYTLALIGGVLLCIVGIVWTWVLFSLATPALLFEDKRGTAAMGRSRQLIADHWWRVFGVLVVGFLIVGVLSAMLGGLLGSVILADSNNTLLNATVSTLVNIAALAVTTPFTAALTAYIYFDLRVRKEGFDLALLARGIGAPSSAPTSPVEGLPAPDAPPSSGFLPPQAPPPRGG